MVTSTAPGTRVAQPVRPFHHHHAARRQVGIEADLVEVDALQPVEIEVQERQAAAGVLVDQGEGRAADHVVVEAEPGGQPAHEHGLADAEITAQQHHVPGGERRRRRPGDGQGLGL